ncbi:hypothetical protein GCM10022213_04690 [Parerythrobacter jejuensis]
MELIGTAVQMDRAVRQALGTHSVSVTRNFEAVEDALQAKLAAENDPEVKRTIGQVLLDIIAFRMFAKRHFIPGSDDSPGMQVAPHGVTGS